MARSPRALGSRDLATAQHKAIKRTQADLDLAPFVFRQGADKNGGSHGLDYTTFPTTFGGNALALLLLYLGRGI